MTSSRAVFALFCLAAASANAAPRQADEIAAIEHDPAAGRCRLTWASRPESTYFFEQSADLVHWSWAPAVQSGDGSVKQVDLPSGSQAMYYRLRRSDVSSPDPAAADYDGDGISNLAEVSRGSDPHDYFDQPGGRVIPAISVVGGDGQSGAPGNALPKRLTVKVFNAATGAPLSGAPVDFAATSGRVSRPQARTGSSGRAAITYTPDSLGPAVITARFASAQAQFVERSISGSPPNAPSGLSAEGSADGGHTLRWVDNSSDEESFAIWRRDGSGPWVEVGVVDAGRTGVSLGPDGRIAR